MIECQTLELMKRNQKVNMAWKQLEAVTYGSIDHGISPRSCNDEYVIPKAWTELQSLNDTGDEAVQLLIEDVRAYMSGLFKICESIAMLDMVHLLSKSDVLIAHCFQISGFAQLVTTHDYGTRGAQYLRALLSEMQSALRSPILLPSNLAVIQSASRSCRLNLFRTTSMRLSKRASKSSLGAI